jgi:hypothetical protein
MRPADAGCTPRRLEGETMPSARSKAGMYIFIVIGIAAMAGAGYYVVKGVLASRDAAPAATTPAK